MSRVLGGLEWRLTEGKACCWFRWLGPVAKSRPISGKPRDRTGGENGASPCPK
ncbi:MAG: hypothetical protein WBD99_16520 [Thermodesulfobacteriota bacterium]